MGDLTAADVELFTDGRLENDNGDGEVTRTPTAALVSARRYVGWHVSPVTDVDDDTPVVLDGPASRILMLPTRKLVTLTSVAEDGADLNLADLTWSAGGPPGLLESPVRVRKQARGWWSDKYQAIEVVMVHGYTEDEAADWRRAVLSMVDQMSLVPVKSATGFSEAGLKSKRIDDVAYSWDNSYSMMAENVLFSVSNILDDYCLPKLEFL